MIFFIKITTWKCRCKELRCKVVIAKIAIATSDEIRNCFCEKLQHKKYKHMYIIFAIKFKLSYDNSSNRTNRYIFYVSNRKGLISMAIAVKEDYKRALDEQLFGTCR